ncbi:MAG TPA: hypothetical protein EYN06_03985, partial [Myxococcales bacterium]|nr:hypothetical protein [Myxococcales bacterium]
MRLITTAIILATSLILACSSTDSGKSENNNDLSTTGSDGDQDIASSDNGTRDTGGDSDVTEDSNGSGSTGADGNTPLACCDSDSDCATGHVCILKDKVCRSEAELSAGKCWTDQHCIGESKCQGVSVCPCEDRCENIIEVVGTCTSVDPTTCQTLDPNSFGPCEAELGIVFDGQNCVTASGCDCGSDCDAFYDTIEACKEACISKDKCADFVAPGCVQSGCPEGQTCDTNAGDCVPSTCSCDPETGEVICTADCGGGVCVTSQQPSDCCAPPNNCGPGMICVKGPNACKDSKALDKGQCWSIKNCATGSQ